jgi:hypothetical protein
MGGIIRLVDGRYKDEFVNREALDELIDEDMAEIFVHDEFHFVRITQEK